MTVPSISRSLFAAALLACGVARAQDAPVGHWTVNVNGWQVVMQIAEANPQTGALSGTMTHQTTGKPDRVMGFWDEERQHLSFYRVADSDQADPRYGAAFDGYMVHGAGPGDPPRMLVGTVTTFTPGAGATKRRQETGWFAVMGDTLSIEVGDRRVWVYEGGWFQTTDGRAWFEMNRDIHNDGLTGFTFEQASATPEYVELLDKSRNLVVRLFRDHAEWRRLPESDWHGLKAGRWLDRE